MLLVAAMIKEDSNTLGVNENAIASLKQDYIRALPSIAPEFTNPKAKALKWEFANTIADLAQPQDDPMYVLLHNKYYGSILYDNETRASHKLFRVSAIQFVRSYSKSRHTCWEATCEPVFLCTATGQYVVPEDKEWRALMFFKLLLWLAMLSPNTLRVWKAIQRTSPGLITTSPISEMLSNPLAALPACHQLQHLHLILTRYVTKIFYNLLHKRNSYINVMHIT